MVESLNEWRHASPVKLGPLIALPLHLLSAKSPELTDLQADIIQVK